MAEKLTHWKKNLDSRYISGEDLQNELNGFKREMVVYIHKFDDSDTFDQKKQETVIKSGLFLRTLDGKDVYKPALLNNINAKFFTKEFGSDFMEHWLNKNCIMYAQPDKRHGFVVRFKPYKKPVLALNTDAFTKCKQALANGFTIDKIEARYTISAEVKTELLKTETNG